MLVFVIIKKQHTMSASLTYVIKKQGSARKIRRMIDAENGLITNEAWLFSSPYRFVYIGGEHPIKNCIMLDR